MTEFKTKSAEELAKLDVEGLSTYYNELNTHKSKELTALIAKNATENKDAIIALKEDLSIARVEQMKSLNETLKQHGLAIKKLSVDGKDSGRSTMTVEKGLTTNLEALKGMKDGKHGNVTFKVAGVMTSANVSGGNVPVEQRLEGVDSLPSRRIRLMDIVSRGTASSNLISWVSQANIDGGAGQTGEGLLKNQMDWDYVVTSLSLKKTTAFVKVSTEMVDDVAFLNTEINGELKREMMKKIEAQVFAGDGLGINHTGITTTASAIDVTDFALSVDNANLVDVLRVAMTNINTRDHDPADYILLNAVDVTKLMLIKTLATPTDRRYIDALQVISGQLMLDGVPIIKTNLVTVGNYTVGNFALATVYDKGDISIEIGRSGDDFTKNIVTVLAEWRGLTLIKTNVQSAFVTGVIATDAALLETI